MIFRATSAAKEAGLLENTTPTAEQLKKLSEIAEENAGVFGGGWITDGAWESKIWKRIASKCRKRISLIIK
jgi:hypothetical protein